MRQAAAAAALALVCAVGALPHSVFAAEPAAPSFPVERLLAAPGGRGIISLEDPFIEGHLTAYVHLLASTGSRPLALSLDEGSEHPTVLDPVTHATSLHLSAALELHRKARFHMVLPLVMLGGNRLQGLGEDRDFPAMSAGDLRVGFTFNIFSGSVLPLDLAAGAQIMLPTGDDGNFAGVDEPGLVLRLLLGSRPVDWAQVLFQFGAIFHDKREFYGSLWGQRLTWGLGLRVGLPWIPLVGEHLGVLAEADGEVCLDCATDNPAELRGGVYFEHGRWAATVSGGAGLSDAATVPVWRVTAGVSVRLGRGPAAP